jgi:hypothetical protein
MVDEKTHMWYTLSGRYGDIAWEMLDDMKGKKFSHKKANKHLAYIMNNWPTEEVCRTMRTWLTNSTIDTSKLDEKLSLEFTDKYGEYIAGTMVTSAIKHRFNTQYVAKQPFEMWPKPSKI